MSIDISKKWRATFICPQEIANVMTIVLRFSSDRQCVHDRIFVYVICERGLRRKLIAKEESLVKVNR